ncbi:hypothetical protein QAD02_017366 [Eretmocerus hayati]|uniref:Uncharacterized protein n=1 Tax=Eretmocerus hayati TaxID=131215 RepID=A0ACC2PG80_9HYME|nr:hypothetical protein QAD02_017366 [Eretmocerus hayati]
MSGLKNVIIALPTGKVQHQQRLQFATSILVDKIKMEKLPLPEPIVIKQEPMPGPRPKKRRLDHLSWEEKLQRKKLKNRVAAQTSRDRKKAKLDELEDTVKILKESNEQLTDECSMLRTQNELLLSEITKLKRDKETAQMEESNRQVCTMCQARVDCTVPTLGSAVSFINPLQQGGTVQTAKALTAPPKDNLLLNILTLYLLLKISSATSKETSTLSDSKSSLKAYYEKLPLEWKQILISEMNRYLSSPSIIALPLEKQFLQALFWHDILINIEDFVKEEIAEKSNDTEEMVGETSSDVETSASSTNLIVEETCDSSQVALDDTFTSIPTITLNSSEPMAIDEQVEIKEEPAQDAEMVYGTYDEATNCITIIYPEDDVNHLAPNQYVCQNSPSYDSMSPASSYHSEDAESAPSKFDGTHSGDAESAPSKFDGTHSDGGYESHGSPESSLNDVNDGSLTNLWHESFSELFPSLI